MSKRYGVIAGATSLALLGCGSEGEPRPAIDCVTFVDAIADEYEASHPNDLSSVLDDAKEALANACDVVSRSGNPAATALIEFAQAELAIINPETDEWHDSASIESEVFHRGDRNIGLLLFDRNDPAAQYVGDRFFSLYVASSNIIFRRIDNDEGDLANGLVDIHEWEHARDDVDQSLAEAHDSLEQNVSGEVDAYMLEVSVIRDLLGNAYADLIDDIYDEINLFTPEDLQILNYDALYAAFSDRAAEVFDAQNEAAKRFFFGIVFKDVIFTYFNELHDDPETARQAIEAHYLQRARQQGFE